MADLPAGTVTFLFTDLEGSTRLLEAHPTAYREAVTRRHALLRCAVEGHGGAVFETVGDAGYAAFARPGDAVAAAVAGQRALQAEDLRGPRVEQPRPGRAGAPRPAARGGCGRRRVRVPDHKSGPAHPVAVRLRLPGEGGLGRPGEQRAAGGRNVGPA